MSCVDSGDQILLSWSPFISPFNSPCVGSIFSETLFLWAPGNIRFIDFQISISSKRNIPFSQYLIGLSWGIKNQMDEKYLEQSLLYYKYISAIIITQKKFWAASMVLIWLGLYVSIHIPMLLLSDFSLIAEECNQARKNLMEREKGRTGNQNYVI